MVEWTTLITLGIAFLAMIAAGANCWIAVTSHRLGGRLRKYDTILEFAAHKYVLGDFELSKILNEVSVVFNDSQLVRSAVTKIFETTSSQSQDELNANVTDLTMAMFADVGLKTVLLVQRAVGKSGWGPRPSRRERV